MQLRSRRQAGEQPGREHGDSRDPGITRQMTSPAARVIADEAWAKLLWPGLKLQAAGFPRQRGLLLTAIRLDEND
jgi:hypothetical protein